MTGASSPPEAELKAIDPGRHPAALANAISAAWRPYRWRAYAVGVLAGLLAGGIVAPIATTTLLSLLYLANVVPPDGVPWQEVLWCVAFAVTASVPGAAVYPRWQPARLRMAVQTYIWLAHRAEANWARIFGAQPVPRDEPRTRAFLASTPETPETAAERCGLWIALLEHTRDFDVAGHSDDALP